MNTEDNPIADPVSLAARTVTTRTCPRCATVFDMPDRGRGRRPVWCSGLCRRLASAERAAARNAGKAVTVVEVPRAHRPDPNARLAVPSMGTLMTLFLSSPVHCRQLLDTLIYRYTHDTLHAELRIDMEAFAASIHRQQTLAADPEYRRATDDVQRLRRHLQMEADRAEDRDRELATLRAESSAKTTLIARLRAELAHPTVPMLETADGGGHGGPRGTARGDDPGVGMSRQQRRAAARDAAKNH
ncbi:hypothetical protein H7J06_31490 [Mycobacterium hodleri]|uniref:hypothetical protein n=1 Tax=Mycolicibacterium hodleri TaxID=49897 RepID=UPI0021F32B92|nr:hypothetical protein [Mycolicibacterium hodleri]MCV7137496.1 hypothetical protein [Mycolicibacterium hodleri]